MPGVIDWRLRFIVVPGMALGLTLSLIALALSISQFILQLRNNEGTVIGTKDIYDSQITHADVPLMTLCSPIPFNTNLTKCLSYNRGLRPVQRASGFLESEDDEDDEDGDKDEDPVITHKNLYNLTECSEDFEDLILYHKIWFKSTRTLLHCVSFAKGAIPSYLGKGAANRIFFELERSSVFDYEAHILRLWDPIEARTPLQVASLLNEDPFQLYSGKTLTLPYSVPGTVLFPTWSPPFDGPISDGEYNEIWEPETNYGPVVVRAGVSATISLDESGTQSLEQEDPIFSFSMDLESITPDVEYPKMDTSKFLTLAFFWKSDTTLYYQTILAITNVGMAALLISTFAFVLLGCSDAVAIWMDYEERSVKS